MSSSACTVLKACFSARLYSVLVLLFWSAGHPAIVIAQDIVDRASWLTLAPPEYQRLLDAGNVAIQASDALLQQKEKVGATEFKLQVGYRFTYKIESNRQQDGIQQTRVRVIYQRPKFRISHVIHVESTYNPPSPWTHGLMKHEMDHLAISTDPRLRAIVDGVLGSSVSVDLRWEQTSAPSDQQIRESLGNRSAERFSDIEKVIQIAYDQLDEASAQGNRRIDARGSFFKQIYSVEWLRSTKLKSFDEFSAEEIESWLANVSKSKLEMHYRETW